MRRSYDHIGGRRRAPVLLQREQPLLFLMRVRVVLELDLSVVIHCGCRQRRRLDAAKVARLRSRVRHYELLVGFTRRVWQLETLIGYRRLIRFCWLLSSCGQVHRLQVSLVGPRFEKLLERHSASRRRLSPAWRSNRSEGEVRHWRQRSVQLGNDPSAVDLAPLGRNAATLVVLRRLLRHEHERVVI